MGPGSRPPGPLVTIIVPCRDEAGFIDACLESLVNQDYANVAEILVAEGESTDGTRERLAEWGGRDCRVVVIDNPGGQIPRGLNKAIQSARGDVVVRADVHTKYAPDYVSQCVAALVDSGADNVGGPWRTAECKGLQKAVAFAFQSPFSSGGALSHDVRYEGYVDSVYLGCWYRSTLLRIGLYDETFLRSEDDELNLRITRAGGRIWQTPKIRSWYFPRSTLLGLFRQYQQWGYWKVRVIRKHRMPASWRHVVPGLALMAGCLLLVLSFISSLALAATVTVFACYLLLSLFAASLVCRRERDWIPFLWMPVVFSVFHLAYGAGLIRGFVGQVVLGRGNSETMTKVTR